MVKFADRDPITLQITDVSTGVVPQDLPRRNPRRPNEIWVCEYVSVFIDEHTSNATPDAYIVELGVDHRGHVTWLDYINLTSGIWTRILNHPITLLSNTLPHVRFFCGDSGLTMRMNAIGYVRAPFTTP